IRLPSRFRGFHCGTSAWIRGQIVSARSPEKAAFIREFVFGSRRRLLFADLAPLNRQVSVDARHITVLTSVMQYLDDNGAASAVMVSPVNMAGTREVKKRRH